MLDARRGTCHEGLSLKLRDRTKSARAYASSGTKHDRSPPIAMPFGDQIVIRHQIFGGGYETSDDLICARFLGVVWRQRCIDATKRNLSSRKQSSVKLDCFPYGFPSPCEQAGDFDLIGD